MTACPHAAARPDADRGEQIIANLRRVESRASPREAWSAWWETLDGTASRGRGDNVHLWQAIKEKHGGLLPVAGGVLVQDSALVSHVYLNAHREYSVSGYARRMRRSFGRIYLGRDAGGGYDREATRSNDAIMGITRRAAFDGALRYAGDVIAQEPDATFNALVVGSLARLCTDWFDLPDGIDVITGETDLDTSFVPARCPGHYDAPSGHVFRPHPEPSIEYFGIEQALILRAATDAYVRRARAGSPPRGVVSSALFATFPDTLRGNELLSRSLVGVMLGFLPTTKFNLLAAMARWEATGGFDAIVTAYEAATGSPFERAADAIEPRLAAAIQQRPQPGAVWRTVAKPHVLGSGAEAVALRPGQMVVIWIEGALREHALRGDPSIFAVFGGDRSGVPAPRHACPGYEAAMGVMLGILAARCTDRPDLALVPFKRHF